jgi:hypothetical protein
VFGVSVASGMFFLVVLSLQENVHSEALHSATIRIFLSVILEFFEGPEGTELCISIMKSQYLEEL